MRTAKSCGPDTSVVGVKSVAATPPMTVSTKPDHRGERDISRKPLRGECRVKPVRPDERVCVLSPPLHTRLAGASSARYSPRPLFRGSRTEEQNSRENTRRDREAVSANSTVKMKSVDLAHTLPLPVGEMLRREVKNP